MCYLIVISPKHNGFRQPLPLKQVARASAISSTKRDYCPEELLPFRHRVEIQSVFVLIAKCLNVEGITSEITDPTTNWLFQPELPKISTTSSGPTTIDLSN